MTAPRIAAEEIAVYEQRLGEEDITFDFVREILDSLYAARSELDRLSAQGGEVLEFDANKLDLEGSWNADALRMFIAGAKEGHRSLASRVRAALANNAKDET